MSITRVVHYVTTYDQWKLLLGGQTPFVLVLLPEHHTSIDALIASHTLETDIYVAVARDLPAIVMVEHAFQLPEALAYSGCEVMHRVKLFVGAYDSENTNTYMINRIYRLSVMECDVNYCQSE